MIMSFDHTMVAGLELPPPWLEAQEVGGTTGTSSSLIAIPTPMPTNSLGAKCFDLKRKILDHASNHGNKKIFPIKQFWICFDMLEVPKGSQVFLPGHGWSRVVTGRFLHK